MQSYITNQLQQQSTNSAKMRPVLLWQPQCSCNKENLTAPPVGHKKGGGDLCRTKCNHNLYFIVHIVVLQ